VFPILIPVRSGVGRPAIAQVTTRIDPQGQIDVGGGLTPGVYQMRVQDPNQEGVDNPKFPLTSVRAVIIEV
jgi:hypothetical protein